MGTTAYQVTDPHRHLIRIVRESLRKRGINPTQFAKLIDMPQTTLSGILRGENDPGLGNIYKIAKGLDVATWQLLHSHSSTESIEMTAVFSAASVEGKRLIRLAVESARAEMEAKGTRTRE